MFQKHSIRVKKIRASRAVYHDSEILRIEIEIHTEYGDKLVLEMTPKQAHALISQTTVAYQAIFPPVRKSQEPYAW